MDIRTGKRKAGAKGGTSWRNYFGVVESSDVDAWRFGWSAEKSQARRGWGHIVGLSVVLCLSLLQNALEFCAQAAVSFRAAGVAPRATEGILQDGGGSSSGDLFSAVYAYQVEKFTLEHADMRYGCRYIMHTTALAGLVAPRILRVPHVCANGD